MSATAIAIAVLLSASVQDFIEGAEVGDAQKYVAFETHGKYHAEVTDKANPAKKAVMKGKWVMAGEDAVEVKVENCRGDCKPHVHPWKAQVAVVADRAMTVRTVPEEALMPSGSYYCRFQGCEQRTGVELLSKGAKAGTVNWVLDYLIDQNRKRDVTVVWWGKKLTADVGKSRIETCGRDPERARKGGELVQADLAALPWLGKLEVTAVEQKDCLWDVRVYLADEVVAPARLKRGELK